MLLPYSSMLHIPLTNYHLLAAKQRSYKTVNLYAKFNEDFLEKKSQENAPLAEKGQD